MNEKLLYDFENMQCFYCITKAPTAKDFCGVHSHEGYELLFFYDGDADFTVGEHNYHLQKNDLLLVKPNVSHRLQPFSSHPYERVVFTFSEDVLLESLRPFAQDANPFYRLEPTSPIKRIFDNIRESLQLFSKEDFEYFSITSLNHIILQLKYFSPVHVKDSRGASTLDEILLYVDENLALPLTITDLARRFGVSESWIAHSFKKRLRISPSQYINRKKIIYAQSLINKGVSPMQAAEDCGYINYTTFYRQYKKYLGVSPAEDAKQA